MFVFDENHYVGYKGGEEMHYLKIFFMSHIHHNIKNYDGFDFEDAIIDSEDEGNSL